MGTVMRSSVRETVRSLRDELYDLASDLVRRKSVTGKYSENPVSVEWFEGQFEPGETALDAPILDELRSCHREMLGSESSTHGVSYGSDLRLFTRYASMPAVLYGPGDVRGAHSANESVPLEELVAAAEVLTLLIARRLDA